MMNDHLKMAMRNLPRIDELIQFIDREGGMLSVRKEILRDTCRRVVENFRRDIAEGSREGKVMSAPTLDEAAMKVLQIIRDLRRYSFRKVINATGVILHTNLGRAPLCREALDHIVEIAGGYSNLEYDLAKGERGQRYGHVRELLCLLTGAEDALVVNNNAAAVLLVLNTLAEGKEVIVSRGELIEIGGEFRIPEVMQKSGARLREVGTTNRTRITDYERAIGYDTALLMKVHTSNFRMVGFTEETDRAALAGLGKKYGIPVMDDLGSGCLIDLKAFGLKHEPTVQEALAAGIDVVTFSGDKLLGGPQAGLILGRKNLIEMISRNPLNRALRIDKLTLAALEATLVRYLGVEDIGTGFRTMRALVDPVTEIRKRVHILMKMLKKLPPEKWQIELKDGFSMAGGGSLPDQGIPTMLLAIRCAGLNPNMLEERLRKLDIPIIARIAGEEILFDLRTIAEEEFPLIRDGLEQIHCGD